MASAGGTGQYPRVTEAQFQSAVIDLAHYRGWLVHHTRAARTEKGWRTPIQGDAGFCDLVLARAGVVLLVELKAEKGRLSPEQKRWASQLGFRYRCWYPKDMPKIVKELR